MLVNKSQPPSDCRRKLLLPGLCLGLVRPSLVLGRFAASTAALPASCSSKEVKLLEPTQAVVPSARLVLRRNTKITGVNLMT